jgi:hypothetical protein
LNTKHNSTNGVTAVQPLQDDRAAFEAWHSAKYGRSYTEWVEVKGRYAWDLTEELWTAWKAARTSGVEGKTT